MRAHASSMQLTQNHINQINWQLMICSICQILKRIVWSGKKSSPSHATDASIEWSCYCLFYRRKENQTSAHGIKWVEMNICLFVRWFAPSFVDFFFSFFYSWISFHRRWPIPFWLMQFTDSIRSLIIVKTEFEPLFFLVRPYAMDSRHTNRSRWNQSEAHEGKNKGKETHEKLRDEKGEREREADIHTKRKNKWNEQHENAQEIK